MHGDLDEDRRPGRRGGRPRSRPTGEPAAEPGPAVGRGPGHGAPLPEDDVPGPLGDDPGDPEAVARAVCLRALTGAPKTRRQLADLLAKRGIPDDAATAVLDRFAEVGLIDDAAFARAWVDSRQAGRGLARRALRAELRAKGVEAEVAAEALALVDEDDEREAARALVHRRLPGMGRLDRPTASRRLLGMLARKGYGGGLAAAVVREALELRNDAAAGSDAAVDGDEDLPARWPRRSGTHRLSAPSDGEELVLP